MPCTTAPDIAINWRRFISIGMERQLTNCSLLRKCHLKQIVGRDPPDAPSPHPPVAPLHRSALESLPQPADGDSFARVSRLVGESRTKSVVLDDDPTGTQTVHGLDVLADWSVPSLKAALADPRPCFYVLTNTRSAARGRGGGARPLE